MSCVSTKGNETSKIFWTYAVYLVLDSNFILNVLSPLILTKTLFGSTVIPIL